MRLLDDLTQDVRLALRRLGANPGFTAVAILTLALGIGANSAIFTLVNAVLLRPLPVNRPEELVEIYTGDSRGNPATSSYPDYLDFAKRLDLFTGVSASQMTILSLALPTRTHVVLGEFASGNYFAVLGVRATRGRMFLPGDDVVSSAPVAVISHRFWQRQFGGAADALGSSLTFNGTPVTIVGIALQAFKGTIVALSVDVWLPIASTPRFVPPANDRADLRGHRSLFVKGRLKRGVTLEQARAGLTVTARQLSQAYPATNEGRAITVVPTRNVRFHPAIDRALMPGAILLMAVPSLVLLIACTNMANLLLARASARRREIAIRLSIGAGRGRLIRQLLTESAVLSVSGGLVGLAVASWAMQAVLAFRPPLPVPVALDLPIDGRVLGFTVTMSLFTGILFGLAPAWQSTRPDLLGALKDDGASPDRAHRRIGLRNLLVVSQVTISLVLLVGAGLFVRSLQRAQDIEPGFENRNAVILSPGLSFTSATPQQIDSLYQRLLERIGALPGVRSVTMAARLPLGAQVRRQSFRLEGDPTPAKDAPEIDVTTVDRGYFRTLDVPLLRGRDFERSDNAGAPKVAIVSDALARRFWPDREPVGQRFLIKDADGPWQVVGVAKDTKVLTLAEDPRPFVYLPYSQSPDSDMSIVARTDGPPESLVETIRLEALSIDPLLPILELKTMEEHLDLMLYPARFGAAMLASFGTLGLLLAALGLYGVVASSVARRTREIGIRMALGAQRLDVVTLVIRESMTLVGVGVLVGLALSVAATRPLNQFLYGVGSTDPLTFVALAGILTLVGLLAAYLPARRATRIEPLSALRID